MKDIKNNMVYSEHFNIKYLELYRLSVVVLLQSYFTF